MRSYSIFIILLLCAAILLVDVLSFYWLQRITRLINASFLKNSIHILFWIFSVGLITVIIILKITLDDINPRRKHLLVSSLYGLTVSSFIPKILFVIIISVLFYGNYVFSENQSLVVIPLVGLLSGVLPFLAISYAIFRAVYHFKIYRHKLYFNHLPESFAGLKIVHISDLHLGGFNKRYKVLKKAVGLINALHTDYIFFTGDLVNNYAWELVGWDKVFNQLLAKKGKYAVLGNHDYGDYSRWETKADKIENLNEIKRFYNDVGFKLLLNSSEIVKRDQEAIAIVGVENWGRPPFKQYGDLQKALSSVSHIPFKILLSHDPTHWNEEVIHDTDIALTLSGHTHGMQLGLNYKNMAWSPIKYKYKHWAGLYEHNKQYLYVNRGLGWIGFPGRLGMRPEITYLELHSNK
ncbi:metallophosphoesterase [Aestuariibaculum sp. YM273]|uniref:metallophosphoesterase n=1 Tax=Aestuariibaculum sp. YM273 TaxID=3070659 RepID=UPI0027DB0A3F|nr:metallophosphoesterase [Aestuariibaculum sp. YM273]WMI65196.1 metallophosphoesterase [Aestuariibaculum sp. YM273]